MQNLHKLGSIYQGWQGNKARPEKARVLLPGFFGLFQVEFEKKQVFLFFFQIFAKKSIWSLRYVFFKWGNTISNVCIIEILLVIYLSYSMIFYSVLMTSLPSILNDSFLSLQSQAGSNSILQTMAHQGQLAADVFGTLGRSKHCARKTCVTIVWLCCHF